MGTITAQMLVGNPHPNHGGITPSHYLFLSENSRPAWLLIGQNIFEEAGPVSPRKTWVPTVENMLEDALLMIAIHIGKDQEIITMASDFCGKAIPERIEMYKDFSDSQRSLLYQRCRQVSSFPKIILTVFMGSTIEKQLSVLEHYKMDTEVCKPIYSRLSS